MERNQLIISREEENGIKFGAIPQEWRFASLKELGVWKGGGTPSKGKEIYWDGNIPWVSPKDFSGPVILDTEDHITTEAIENSVTSLIKKNSILIVVRSGILRRYVPIAKNLIDVAINQDLKALTVNQEYNAEYVFQALLAFATKIKEDTVKVGTTVESIDFSALMNFIVPIPPLGEQRKIVTVLSTWDEAIALSKNLIAALQERKKGLMQQLLTGEKRCPGFGKEWKKVMIGDLLSQVSRSEKVQKNKIYRLIGVRWYASGAYIHDTISGEQIVTRSLSCIHENDILYNKMWITKNAFAIAKKDQHGAYGTNEYPQFVANPEKLDTAFLGYLFNDTAFQYQAHRLCKGTTGRARLNPSDFLKIEINLPEIDEQKKIADILNVCDQELALQIEKLSNLQLQKKGLMQHLLIGEVRVTV
jgi:type I restriction enzyme S subunit